tara:strand:- start:62729 stop:63205 length:477 start_codon:yes stop_codon:yes gene_type:complete
VIVGAGWYVTQREPEPAQMDAALRVVHAQSQGPTQPQAHDLNVHESSPAPVDSVQMLRDRRFSDGYVSPHGPTVIAAGPGASATRVQPKPTAPSKRAPSTDRKWTYVHSSSCDGLRSRRRSIVQALDTLRDKLPVWRQDQLHVEHRENLERERLGLCR